MEEIAARAKENEAEMAEIEKRFEGRGGGTEEEEQEELGKREEQGEWGEREG